MKLSEIARRAYDAIESGREEYSCHALAHAEGCDEIRSIAVRRFKELFCATNTYSWLENMVTDALNRFIGYGELRSWRLGMLNHFIKVLEENGE